MVTKSLKFLHKNHNNSARTKDRSQNFAPNWGFWGLADQPESNFRESHPCCHGNKIW